MANTHRRRYSVFSVRAAVCKQARRFQARLDRDERPGARARVHAHDSTARTTIHDEIRWACVVMLAAPRLLTSCINAARTT